VLPAPSRRPGRHELLKGGETVFLNIYTRIQSAWAEFRSRFEDETGAVATEYVFLLVLIALAITGGMIFLATQINQKFSDAGTGVSGT
jgi:Flp pilus assembly pilin Flp